MEADESQLRQVMLNLLLNALDVLPDGGNIWIDVCGDEASVTIFVADDGPGIAAEVMDTIFEPFVSTKVTGIGLGLSICRQIVDSHDGRIAASNRAEGGAEFTIMLRTGTGSGTSNFNLRRPDVSSFVEI